VRDNASKILAGVLRVDKPVPLCWIRTREPLIIRQAITRSCSDSLGFRFSTLDQLDPHLHSGLFRRTGVFSDEAR